MPIEVRYPNAIKVMIPILKRDELYELENIVVRFSEVMRSMKIKMTCFVHAYQSKSLLLFTAIYATIASTQKR